MRWLSLTSTRAVLMEWSEFKRERNMDRLRGPMLNETSQTEKDNHMISFIFGSLKKKKRLRNRSKGRGVRDG